MQQNHHVIRRQYVKHMAVYETTMANGNFGSPDSYYGWKKHERELAAELKGLPSYKNDPMYFHHGGMSN